MMYVLELRAYKIRTVDSKTQTYHGHVGSKRRTAGPRGGIDQNGSPTERFAQGTISRTLQGIENTCPERLSRSTNKRNRIQTDGETQRALDAPDDGRSSFLAADQWTDAFFVSVNPLHKACPDKNIITYFPFGIQLMQLAWEQNHRFIRGLSAGREALFVPGC